jgi:SAM-dependent methyltransferase
MNSSPDTLTDTSFWSGFWRASTNPDVSPSLPFDAELISLFRRFGEGHGVRFLEVGCGDSRWMPWLGRNLGWAVEGIEYTTIGCERAQARLNRDGVPSQVHLGDVFGEGAKSLQGQFDVVYSGGFIEHFRNTEETVRHLSAFVRPGGAMLTTVPNMYNIGVDLQRLIGEDFLKTHVRIQLSELRRWHEGAGLRTIQAYRSGFGVQVRLLGMAPVVNVTATPPRSLRRSLLGAARTVVRAFRTGSRKLGLGEPRGRLVSLNLVYAGFRPKEWCAGIPMPIYRRIEGSR